MVAAFDPVIVLEHEADIGGVYKCLYYLTKREQAHHTNYPALLELAELLGCDHFKKLKVKNYHATVYCLHLHIITASQLASISKLYLIYFTFRLERPQTTGLIQ